jgi:competence protein ComEC
MGAKLGPAARWGWPACGWLVGTALQLQQPALSSSRALLLLAAGALFAALAVWRWRGGWWTTLTMALATAALAFALTSGRAAQRLADALPAALEGQDLLVTGVVASMPRVTVTGTRFVFELESASWRGEAVRAPGLLSLGWYRGADDEALLAGPGEELRAGQRWQFTVRLRQPHGTANPHGFDLELWLFEQGIRASGSVRVRLESPARKLDEDAGHGVERLRQSVRDAIQDRVADPGAAGVLAALSIGDQAAIERDDWDLFRITGVAHLMSISGLHVTMFAWLAGALIGRLWRLQPRLLLACPAPQAARWGGLAAALAYSVLAGWGVPAQRTVAMIGLVVALRSLGARWPLPLVLLAAAVGVTALDPWALLQPGFWLSFVAVGLLVASDPVQAEAAPPVAGWRQRLLGALRGGVRTQAVATVGLAPLSMVFFQQVSLVGFVANLVAIPLVTLLIAPLSLLGVLLPPLWLLDGALVQGLMALLKALAGWPAAVWTAAAAPPWAVACGLLAALVAVLPLPWRLRLLAAPLLLPVLVPPVPRPATGQFELVAADIGQGTAVLVRTANHLLVYDAGPRYSPEADAGVRVLLPLLRARGEPRVDLLMLSHRDIDHVGGAASLIAGLPVAALSSSLEDAHPLLAQGLPHRRCDAGQAWDWDGVHFDVLHPLAADHGLGLKTNALSCVLRVQGDGRSALLTGDIESAQEAALVQRAGPALASDVLLAPHHGSRTSSSTAFLDAVRPEVAVFQAGYRSRFGHPAPDIVARYQARGIEVVRSDRCGAWTLPAASTQRAFGSAATAASAPQPWCEREVARRYWHDPGLVVPSAPAAP